MLPAEFLPVAETPETCTGSCFSDFEAPKTAQVHSSEKHRKCLNYGPCRVKVTLGASKAPFFEKMKKHRKYEDHSEPCTGRSPMHFEIPQALVLDTQNHFKVLLRFRFHFRCPFGVTKCIFDVSKTENRQFTSTGTPFSRLQGGQNGNPRPPGAQNEARTNPHAAEVGPSKFQIGDPSHVCYFWLHFGAPKGPLFQNPGHLFFCPFWALLQS